MSSAGIDSAIKTPSVGRVLVKIYSAQDIKLAKPAVSVVKPHVFIRVILGPFTCDSSIRPCEDIVN